MIYEGLARRRYISVRSESIASPDLIEDRSWCETSRFTYSIEPAFVLSCNPFGMAGSLSFNQLLERDRSVGSANHSPHGVV